MSIYPDWLPNIYPVKPWKSDTYDQLYNLFKNDFINTTPKYNGSPVWIFPEKEDNKEVIFWHLTTKQDKITRTRYPDFDRCERLPWPRSLIDNPCKPEVLSWDFKEGDGGIKTYIWLKDLDYLVIMKKYSNNSCRLLTSFNIEHKSYKSKLLKKYKKRIQ
jgi:hypothetical protein